MYNQTDAKHLISLWICICNSKQTQTLLQSWKLHAIDPVEIR